MKFVEQRRIQRTSAHRRARSNCPLIKLQPTAAASARNSFRPLKPLLQFKRRSIHFYRWIYRQWSSNSIWEAVGHENILRKISLRILWKRHVLSPPQSLCRTCKCNIRSLSTISMDNKLLSHFQFIAFRSIWVHMTTHRWSSFHQSW